MISLRDMEPDARLHVVGRILGLLVQSGFKDRERWPFAVVIMRAPGERSYVTSRPDFAAYLRETCDLPGAARECTSRRTRGDELLLWLEVDEPDLAAAGFEVINLVREVRRLANAA